MDVKVLTRPRNNQDSHLSHTSGLNMTWPYIWREPNPPTLTTYMRTENFDISNAARPCRSINNEPVLAQVQTLNHVPFTYVIAVQSTRPLEAYGMVRIFMWPEHMLNGTKLECDHAHVRAIELDRFRVKITPDGVTVITRNSLNSTVTRVGPSPGLKSLYNVQTGSYLLTDPQIKRACGFPNNLLIPKGTKEGMAFKLTVYVSDETDAGEIKEDQYPHYPYCGALNGLPFPDKRPMGFPFDRPGTRFNYDSQNNPPFSSELPCSMIQMTNVKQLKVFVKYDDQEY